MEVITKYSGAKDLKSKIIQSYLHEIENEAVWLNELLSDKTWASDTDSEYHKEVRSRIQSEVAETEKQIKLLRKKE